MDEIAKGHVLPKAARAGRPWEHAPGAQWNTLAGDQRGR
jgi:hypothetical protein